MDTSTDLTTSSLAPRSPAPLAEPLRASLSRAAGAVERAPEGRLEISSDYAPTQPEREAFGVRARHLEASLQRPKLENVMRRVAKLFLMLSTGGLDAESSDALVTDYATLLSSQPLWAIDAACMQVLNSGATFRPSAPEFLAIARKHAEPYRTELYEIGQVLKARVCQTVSPEQRARVGKMLREFADGFGSRLDRPRELTPAQHLSRAEYLGDRYSALTCPPLGTGTGGA